MNNEKWIKGEYDTSFINRYKILDQVIDYVKNTKTQSNTQKNTAAITAVQSFITASNK